MWVMAGSQGDGRRVVLYNYSPYRNAEVAEPLLEGYKRSLQTDACSGYNSVGAWKGIWHVGCMQQARHKFFEAHVGANEKSNAKTALKYFKRFYRIERELYVFPPGIDTVLPARNKPGTQRQPPCAYPAEGG
jgi:hypothetical protein